MANKNELWIKMKHDVMIANGISNPIKVDNFVTEVYTLMKKRDFSIIESCEIIKLLSDLIENDKKLILREPLKIVEKYNKEG